MRLNCLTGIALSLIISLPLGAQTVSRTDFTVVSSLRLNESLGLPDISTAALIGGRFVPLSSIHFNLGFLVAVPDTIRFFHADDALQTFGFVVFDGASLVFPGLLGSPLTGMLFTGRYTEPQSSRLMREAFKQDIDYPRFGSNLLGSAFSGSAVIDGTGAGLWGIPGNGPAALALYAYWNAKPLKEAVERNEAHIALVSDTIRLNASLGTRIHLSTADFRFRGDLAASLGDTEGNEFFAQMGLLDTSPGSNMTEEAYLLFEPRLHKEHALFAVAFFSTPVYVDTGFGEEAYGGTYIGANFLAAAGSIERDRVRLGIAVSGAMDPQNPGVTTPLSFSVNPFFEAALSDFLLESSLSINPFRLANPAEAGEFRVILKAVY